MYRPLPHLPPDIQVAHQTALRPIAAIAETAGLHPEELHLFGPHIAKIQESAFTRTASNPNGKLILVTAMTATKAGEGKTVTTIGLGQALQRLGKKAMVCLREPSLGPTFGMKGGATGGGRSQVVPMEDINLHFTGDFHAITTAHNLLAAVLDNHVFHGNALGVDTDRVFWRRVLDLCDRQLRHCETGLGTKFDGYPRLTGFDITASSEIMAILALAENLSDLIDRLNKIVLGSNTRNEYLTAAQLHCIPSIAVLLKHALQPNLVQTLEGTPTLIHAGPFANIAHGCNSVRATKLALKLADYVVTEAGFAADLGAEKFLHLKCRQSGLQPSLAVLVVSCRAIQLHGGLTSETGLGNVRVHIENLRKFGLKPIVALNRFPTDTAEELDAVRNWCVDQEVSCAISEVAAFGGEGGEELAKAVLKEMPAEPPEIRYLYSLEDSLKGKIETLAREVYRAEGVDYTPEAEKKIAELNEHGAQGMPICVAKTQLSISDNKDLLGAPGPFRLQVRDFTLSQGAGFVVVLTGKMLLMPGMPPKPNVQNIGITPAGEVTGLS